MKKGGTILLLKKKVENKDFKESTTQITEEIWGSLTELCENNPQINYNSLRSQGKKNFPLTASDNSWTIELMYYRVKAEDYHKHRIQ